MTVERQVGERLSERKNAAAFHDLLARGDWPQAWALYDEAITRGDSLARHLAEAERALGDLLWLANNRHNYGSPEWLRFFDAAVEDARAALHPPDPPASPAEGSEAATEVEA